MTSINPSVVVGIRRRLAVSSPVVCVLSAVALAWLILFLSIPPRLQNFPVIDDWSFANLAYRFARGEGFRYDGWPSMPVIGQCLWATPLIWAFGESFVLMRLATLVLMVGGVIALFDLLRSEPGVSARSAAFGTAAMAFNPFFFTMSGTFMTDVSTLSFSLIALSLVRRGTVSERAWPFFLGGLAAVLATTTRQNAVAAALAIAVLPAKNQFARKGKWIVAVTALVAGVITVIWFAYQPKVNVKSILWPTSQRLTDLLLRHGQVLGLSAIPVLLLRPRRMLRPGYLFWLMVFGLWTWGWLYFNFLWYKQPYLAHIQPHQGDVIRFSGLYCHETWMPAAGPFIRSSMTVVGCIGLAGLLAGPGGGARVGASGRALLVFTALHVLLMSMIDLVYDRYMVVLLPGVMLRTIPRSLPMEQLRTRWWLGLTALGLLAVGSVAIMHDWLSWNSAKWELGRRAIARGIHPEHIDGGLEWNGWHASKIRKPFMIETPPKNLTINYTRDVFPNVLGLYAFDIDGWGWGLPPELRPTTKTVDTQTYSMWLSPRPGRMELVTAK